MTLGNPKGIQKRGWLVRRHVDCRPAVYRRKFLGGRAVGYKRQAGRGPRQFLEQQVGSHKTICEKKKWRTADDVTDHELHHTDENILQTPIRDHAFYVIGR